jgi:hypothetical protein
MIIKIKTEDDLLRASREIWKRSMNILGEDPERFPKDDRWVIHNNNNQTIQWDTGLTAIFRQGTGYTIPVEIVWRMPTFHAWYFSDDQKIMSLWYGFRIFMLRILGDPKRIEGGLEFIDVVSPPTKQQDKSEEEPRWKQRRRNLRSDFPLK